MKTKAPEKPISQSSRLRSRSVASRGLATAATGAAIAVDMFQYAFWVRASASGVFARIKRSNSTDQFSM
jgi:hypothetical protein